MTNLQYQRIKKNITQSQLAKICNLSLGTLQAYEQGRKSIDGAHIKTLAVIARALDCTIIDLIEDEEIKNLLKNYLSDPAITII